MSDSICNLAKEASLTCLHGKGLTVSTRGRSCNSSKSIRVPFSRFILEALQMKSANISLTADAVGFFETRLDERGRHLFASLLRGGLDDVVEGDLHSSWYVETHVLL